MATPSVLAFDAEGRAINFDVWVDDLQLFLQCDRADGLSLFDLTSGASPAPSADADATVRSQWATRDAAARLAVRRHLPTSKHAHFSQYKSAQTLYDAVVARYSSPATAALSRLMLPYLFPDLAAFPTVADLITHLRTSDTRYRAALPAEGIPPPPFCPLLPLLLRPNSLVLSRSVWRLPLAGDASLARARGAGAQEELAGAVEAAVEAAEGLGVAVGVVAGVEVSVAAVEAEEAAAVAVGTEVAAVEEAVVEEVELVGVALHRGSAPVVRGGGTGPCTYVLRTGDRAGEQCGGAHPTQRCFGRLTDTWRHQFPEATEIPRWGELSRAGVAVFDLDFDAILAAIYAVTISDEGDCYRCFPPDPGIETAALGTGEAAALGASEAATLGARASAPSGTCESALSVTASASASHTFTLDSGASRSFFRDHTTLTPLGRPVAVSLADPSGGRVLAHFSTVLPCPAAPYGTLSGLYLPSFSTNWVSGAALQDAGVHQFTPASQRVTHCTDARTGRHLATFTRWPGSSLYTLTTASPPVTASGQVAASRQVFAAASRLVLSLPPARVASCLTRLSSGTTALVTPPCFRAAPHSSQFPPTEAPLQTLHMDVWGPARVRGQGHERYFMLVVDDYSRYTTVFPLRSKGDVTEINLHPRVSMPETSPALLWTGKVGDASAFRVWGSQAFVCDLSADKLSPRAAPCVFLGFPPHAPGWKFYHPTSRRVLSSQDVTFDELVPYYRLFPYRTPSLPQPLLFLVPGPPPVDPLPPQGPAPSGVSQVDAVEPVEVTGDSGAAEDAEPGGADSGGAERVGAEPGGGKPGGAITGGAEPGGAEPGDATHGGAEPGGAEPEGAVLARVSFGGAGPGGSSGTSSRREPLSPQELREWFSRHWRRAAGAGGSSAAEGAGAAVPGGAPSKSTRAAGPAGTSGARAAEGVGAEATTVGPGGGPTGGATGAAGGTGAGGAAGAGAAAGGSAVLAVSGVAARPRTYFVPLLQQVLGLPPSTGPPPPLECPQPVPSQLQLQAASPLPAPSPYTSPTSGLAERREPASRSASPVCAACTSGRGSRQRPPPVPGTHRMSLRPSTAPLRAPLPSPPESSLLALADPESDSLRAASPTITRLLATVITDPSFESTAASALVAELVDFAARCRLDYAASLVAESESICPPSVGGDPDALDIPTLRSYAEAIEGPYSSQWQAAMDAEMAS
ncbi:unnamed protein product [Closterium sp. NIES-64]|nr:unnamed protein product [Closterium sp. NIES-64]